MAVFNEPNQWEHPLGNNADTSTLPDDAAATAGIASLQKLFQIINATPLEAGGIAPDREDVNALFKYLGDQIFYTQNGGIPSYNAAYDYVAGRVVSYNDNIYKCIQANGVSSTVVAPDSDTAYWQRIDNSVRSVNGVNADANGNITLPLNYLPLSGGTLTGGSINLNSNNSRISINGGTSYRTGAVVEIYGKDFSEYNLNGGISLLTVDRDGNSKYRLDLYSNGSLQWDGKNIVRSVNDVIADANGNITLPLNYLPLSGGTLTGGSINLNSNNSRISINGGTSYSTGAAVEIYGKDFSEYNLNGGISLLTVDSDGISKYRLDLYSNGSLQWDGKNIVRSVNGVNADGNGNVDIAIGTVKTVNGVNADANGNITLPLNYLPLSGGTLTDGSINLNSNNSRISINGGTSYSTGAAVEIYGKDFSEYNLNGGISLLTVDRDGNSKYRLDLYSNGSLQWGGREVNPVGEVCFFARSNAPSGYLVCNGANVSRTTYADLFAVIGTTYGNGDGSTTFTLPNLIDKFAQGSTTVGTYKNPGLPNISATLNSNGMEDVTVSGALAITSSGVWGYQHTPGDVTDNYSLDFSASRSSSIYGNSSTVQPPALTLLPCIRY